MLSKKRYLTQILGIAVTIYSEGAKIKIIERIIIQIKEIKCKNWEKTNQNASFAIHEI